MPTGPNYLIPEQKFHIVAPLQEFPLGQSAIAHCEWNKHNVVTPIVPLFHTFPSFFFGEQGQRTTVQMSNNKSQNSWAVNAGALK